MYVGLCMYVSMYVCKYVCMYVWHVCDLSVIKLLWYAISLAKTVILPKRKDFSVITATLDMSER